MLYAILGLSNIPLYGHTTILSMYPVMDSSVASNF